MNELQIYQVTTDKGRIVELEYDQEGDMLEIFFARGPASGAIELADPLILRFNRETGQALSLSVLTFSQIIQPTELGPRSFQLDGLAHLPSTLRKKVLNMITTPPSAISSRFSPTTPRPSSPPFPSAISSGRRHCPWPPDDHKHLAS